MALDEYIGSIVMEVDGRDIEITDLRETVNTGRKLVKTMNRTGRAKGFARGIEEITLNVTVAIPDNDDLDWGAIEGAKITQYPLYSTGKRISYLDCFSTECGAQYTVDSEARRDITMNALRRVEE
jgi:hypothetical protein